MTNKTIVASFNQISDIVTYAKALASEDRIKILALLDHDNYTINEIADHLSLPVSTTALHIKSLEEANLVTTQIESATRGTKKVCFKNVESICFDLQQPHKKATMTSHYIQMPIGNFSDFFVNGMCGLVNEHMSLGIYDNPAVFCYPERSTAQLIWFEHGFLEYRFPLDVLQFGELEALEFTFECCSEAPSYNLNWPSDITVSVNDTTLHTFTSPGDFGGRRGKLNPLWWPDTHTQYGQLQNIKISQDGVYYNEVKVASTSLDELTLSKQPFLTFKIGIEDNALNKGGINLFGDKFGDYQQSITLRIDYRK